MNSKTILIKIHILTDSLLPYAIILLGVDLFFHLFVSNFYSNFEIYFSILQWSCLSVFFSDLIFKFSRAATIPQFLKTSWFDILAIFPFFLLFRVFETLGLIGTLSGAVGDIQGVVGTGSDIERKAHFERFLKPLLKTPRFAKVLHFYNSP